MIDALWNFGLRVCDHLFGWTLSLPRDISLWCVAILSILLFWGIRRCLINRDRQRTIRKDVQQLKHLSRVAKSANNAEARLRHRKNRGRVAWCKLKAEFPAVFISTLVFLALIQWGESRLSHFPLEPNEPFQIQIEFPSEATNKLAHIVPQEGVESSNGWIQRIQFDPAIKSSPGQAKWNLVAASGYYKLTIRFQDQSFVHPVSVGNELGLPTKVKHTQFIQSEVQLKQYHPCGILPGISWFNISPWLTGFLIVLVPCYVVIIVSESRLK